MPVIYIKEQGAILRKRGGRILVEKDDQTLLEIPLRQTDSVAVFGNVQLTTPALSQLLDRGIPLALYTRHGRFKGHLAPEFSRNVTLRLAQYQAALDEAAALRIARPLVRAKLLNSAALVADYRAHYPSDALARAQASLLELAPKAAAAAAHAELLGYEGAGAAAYFDAFPEMNRSEFPFPGRQKHPSRDPINALLSLGYTFLLNELRGLLEGLGWEPHIGFLHRADYGRPSLALDLLEPFRAVIADRLALRLVNERILQAADFATRASAPLPGSVVLVPDSFPKYVEAYEAAMSEPRKAAPDGMRRVLQADTQKLAAALREAAAFQPYLEEP